MSADPQKLSSFLIELGKQATASITDIKAQLENKDVGVKIAAMKDVLTLLANGRPLPQLLMTIIRFIVPSEDHMLKKLTLLYWEVVDKTDSKGNLLAEMILVWLACLFFL